MDLFLSKVNVKFLNKDLHQYSLHIAIRNWLYYKLVLNEGFTLQNFKISSISCIR
jgi:hypothetical protein